MHDSPIDAECTMTFNYRYIVQSRGNLVHYFPSAREQPQH